MKVVDIERTIFCDVDDTLVMHRKPDSMESTPVWPIDPATGELVKVYRNAPMIKCLLEEKHRGSFVVVWSMGGWEWARNVLTALGIEDKVDLVMTKPFAYFDDKHVNEWLTYRVYIKPEVPYKRS